MNAIASTWPPPPDLYSVKELVSTADVEGFIAAGSPADEYDTEAELLFERIHGLPTAGLIARELLPFLEEIWREDFSLDEAELAKRRPALEALAHQIEHFFGPEAQPHVR